MPCVFRDRACTPARVTATHIYKEKVYTVPGDAACACLYPVPQIWGDSACCRRGDWGAGLLLGFRAGTGAPETKLIAGPAMGSAGDRGGADPLSELADPRGLQAALRALPGAHSVRVFVGSQSRTGGAQAARHWHCLSWVYSTLQ